jgi:hypothetical protein
VRQLCHGTNRHIAVVSTQGCRKEQQTRDKEEKRRGRGGEERGAEKEYKKGK